MSSFLDFVNKRNAVRVFEAFNEKDVDKAVEKINALLSKHIKGLVPLVGYQKTTSDKQTFLSSQYLIVGNDPKKSSMFQINWSQQAAHSVEAYSIDFFKNVDYLFAGKGKSDLTIYTLGSSIVYFLPIIWTVASSGNYNLTQKQAIELGRSVFKDSKVKESEMYVGALKYHIFENMDSEEIFKMFEAENIDPKLKEFKKRKSGEAGNAYNHRGDSLEAKELSRRLVDEYNTIRDAIKGGATNLSELKLAVKHNVSLVAEIDAVLDKEQKKLEQEHQDPEVVFAKMAKYVKMVIKGVTPSVILCGAPGVGKTYSVKKQLKAAGYQEGQNMFTIKGKCTPRQLYLRLYEFQKTNDIVVIDDADGLVGPNAPEDCINILKAALDSTSDDEGRLVSYGVSGKLVDDEGMDIPKRFYYKGGVIVITNYQAGALDSAFKGRSFIQDIHFTTEDILNRIKQIMPEIDKAKLTMKAKLKAFDHLKDMLEKKEEMVLSFRTFGICAKIFQSMEYDDEMTEEMAKEMISEQMRMQALREKNKKY